MIVVGHRQCALCPEGENEHHGDSVQDGAYCEGCVERNPKAEGHVFQPRGNDEPWRAETTYLRQRVASWLTSSGGSAMHDDDRHPNHLLFLLGVVLMENDWTLPPDAEGAGPCPVRSSLTEASCLLPDGHPSYSPERFHKYPFGFRRG